MRHTASLCFVAFAIIVNGLRIEPAQAEILWGIGLQGSFIATQSADDEELDKICDTSIEYAQTGINSRDQPARVQSVP